MNLLSLPPELLTLIFRELGPIIRTSVDYLLISRQWYRTALPAFLSGLSLSTIYLSSYDLLRLPPSHTPLSNLIARQVERLSIRLVGHPSRQLAKSPWNTYGKSYGDNSNGDPLVDPAGWDYWMSVGPEPVIGLENGNRKSYRWHKEEHQLHPWRRRINEKLVELASILPKFKKLKELSFEASSEEDGALGPRWDYLFGSTAEKLLKALPTNLKTLTFDTCGTTLVALAKSEYDHTPVHLCSLVALRLQDLETVRLRMRHICPQVFDNSTNLSDLPSKLSSLVIRLTLPVFPEASYEEHNNDNEYDVQKCPSGNEEPCHVLDPMVTAGVSYAECMKLSKMRITYRSYIQSDINLLVADCLRKSTLHEPSEILVHDDDGREWEAWEENDESLQVLSDFPHLQ